MVVEPLQNTVKMRFLAILFSFICHISIAICVPWEPEPRNETSWLARHAQFVQTSLTSNGTIRAIFFGASNTEYFPSDLFNTNYGQNGAVNYGISGDGVEHALWRIINDELTSLENSLKLIVFSDCGSTRAGSYTSDEIVRGYTATLQYIRQTLPNVKILLMGLLPRDNVFTERWIRSMDVNIQNSKWDNGNPDSMIKYLDLWTQFSERWEVVEPNLFLFDEYHLTRQGYEKWVQIMNPLFQQMLNS